MAECRPVRMSRDVTSGRSNMPRHRKVLYFPHRHLWIMEYSCKVWCKPCRRRLILRQHSRHSWRLRLMAFDHRTLDEALSAACRQEGEMEQYLEEKKASQKRLATTFQRQDKKKAVYPTQQRSVAVGSSQMKDYDAILGLDWLEEHYALVDCRRKRIDFRIPGEDEFSHPLPRNLAGKLVISAMKVMRMAFVAQLSLRSSVLDEVIEQQKVDPRLLELVGKAGIARDEDGGSWNTEEGIPDLDRLWRLLKNPEEGFLGSFLGLPKESFTATFDPFGEFLEGKQELGINALDAEIPCVRPAILPSTPGTARDRR
ncbi:hypothetical protein Taro_014282 [Colocasia esculenta]|uniref:Uncharacterized protein n=1 Tax=Colocasia esculenta TaxID=4460 RepID=A0A843UE29_COLES|nr:hypothetical protein [Colocasia esculenta]